MISWVSFESLSLGCVSAGKELTLCPTNTLTKCPVFKSHKRQVLSDEPEAT